MSDPTQELDRGVADSRPRPGLRLLPWTLAGLALILVLSAVFLTTDTALQMVTRRAIAASEGRLDIVGARGSLLSAVLIDRLAWRGDTMAIDAEQLAVTWTPAGLLSRQLNVNSVSAKRIALTLRASEASKPPGNFALPLGVNLERVGVERLEWRAGTKSGVRAMTLPYGSTKPLIPVLADLAR